MQHTEPLKEVWKELEEIEQIQQIKKGVKNEWEENNMEEYLQEMREDTEEELQTGEEIVRVINEATVRDCWLNMKYMKGTRAGKYRLSRQPKWCATTTGAYYIQVIDCEEERKDPKSAYRNYLLRHIKEVALWEPEKWLSGVEELE